MLSKLDPDTVYVIIQLEPSTTMHAVDPDMATAVACAVVTLVLAGQLPNVSRLETAMRLHDVTESLHSS